MSVSILSWNVHNRPDEGPRPERHRRIAQTLLDSQADICCLQEVGPALRAALPSLLPDYHCCGRPRAAGDESVPVLVRRDAAEVVAEHTFWLGPAQGSALRAFDARHPRCATAVDLTLPAGRLSVLSCHLDHRGRRARLLGASQLADWAAEHRPSVVAGDLNAVPGAPAYCALVGPPPLLRDGREAAAAVEGPPHTWRGPGGWLRRRLDHLLVDHRIRVARHRTIPPEAARRAPSDHHPIVVELLLPAEQAGGRSSA